MTSLKMQLEEFFLTRLSVVWHFPSKPEQVGYELSFGYDVARHATEPRRFMLTFTMHIAPKEKTPLVGYEIDCKVIGMFAFVEGVDEAEMQPLIRINGCTILYGIMRGHIAGVTGSFAGGKYNLPTVMMHEVVQVIEADKAVARAKKNSEQTATPQPKA